MYNKYVIQTLWYSDQLILWDITEYFIGVKNLYRNKDWSFEVDIVFFSFPLTVDDQLLNNSVEIR